MRLTVVGLLAVGVLALAGCSAPSKTARQPRKGLVKAVVSLSPATTELYCAQTSCQGLVGRTSSCDYPNQARTNGKVVVDGTVPNYQLITELKPDLVMYDANLYGPAETEKIKAGGWKLYPFNAKTLDEYIDYVAGLAKMTGHETDASGQIDRMVAEVNNAHGICLTAKNPVVAAIVMPGPNLYVSGTKSLQADLFKRCGVTLVGPATDKFADWNAEELIKADPPAIVVPEGGTDLIMKDPRFQGLKAVKNKQVIEVKSRAILRVGIDLDVMVKALIPRIAKAADL